MSEIKFGPWEASGCGLVSRQVFSREMHDEGFRAAVSIDSSGRIRLLQANYAGEFGGGVEP